MKSNYLFIILLIYLVLCAETSSAMYAQSKLDNTYIYFVSNENSRGRDIVRINADGTSRVKLTGDNGKNHYPHHNGPKLSPDGKKIAYHSDTDRHDKYAIWTMNIDGSNKIRITQEEGLYASWNPDGKTIVFSGRRNGVWEILMIPSSGGKEINLSNNLRNNKRPGWGALSTFNPNGKSIVYSYVRENVLYTMDLYTKNAVQLTLSGHKYTQPVFSRDGSRIAVNRKTENGYDMVTMLPDGTDIKVIVNNVVSYSAPAWSSTGNELLFCGMVNRSQELFKINLSTNNETRLTKNSIFDALPTW